MSLKIAVVGATGNVGREMLSQLEKRNIPAKNVVAIASARSAGSKLPYLNAELTVKDLASYDFSGTSIALFSAGGSTAIEFAPKAAEAGCIVIDNSSAWRMNPNVPLVVPEVNADAIAEYTKRNIIANPNCSTIQMVVALQPLHNAFGLKRVAVSTYQSVSGAGKAAMDELSAQTAAIPHKLPMEIEKFPKQIAQNLIPHIDVFMEDGSTKEEWKMKVETDKIMKIQANVHATCVRVPVPVSHSESIHAEFEKLVDLAAARKALKEAQGVKVVDERLPGGYITPLEATGQDDVFISRLRIDPTVPNGLSFWCVADNLRKGAATNAVQIADILIEKYL